MDNFVDANITGSRNGLSFVWTVEGGSIIEGQGTARLTVKPPDVNDCESKEITVTLRVEGLPESCTASTTRKYGVFTGICDVFPFEYDPAKLVIEKAIIYNAAIPMSYNPKIYAFVVFETSNKHPARVARVRLQRVRRIFKQRGVLSDKLAFYFQKSKQKSKNDRTIIWLLPRNVKVPDCEDCKPIQ